MSVIRPYKRTIRQFSDGEYTEGGRWMYMRHPQFCKDPEHYVRAFEIIQKDLIELFDYIEPDDINCKTYSYRIHEIFMRTCVEIEANFKAILRENGYRKSGNWTIKDYQKIEMSHFLSMYQVKVPIWRSGPKILKPYEDWLSGLEWYKAYNDTKHNRHEEFRKANFENLVTAISALVALLDAQFLGGYFGDSGLLVTFGPSDGFTDAIGGYFKVKFPDIPLEERYHFSWEALKHEAAPFDSFPYPSG